MKYFSFSNRFLLLFFLLALSSLAQSAYAEDWIEAELERVYPLSNGAFILRFTEDSSCQSSNQYHYVEAGKNNVVQEAVPMMLSVALTAFSLQSKLRVYFEEEGGVCYINRMRIVR